MPDTGYGLAWSAGADVVFYVRMDEAQRPYQLWRHRLGTDPAGDELVYEEDDRRFTLGTGTTRDAAFVLVGLHSTNTSEWRAIPSGQPLADPAVVMARREGVEYALDHLTPAAGGVGWFVALTNEDALDFRVIAARDTELGSGAADAWREVIPHRPGVRVEDVDAFAGALVLSERAEAETRVRVLPLAAIHHRDGTTDPFGADPLAGGWVVPSPASPSTTWLGVNPEPDAAGAACRPHDAWSPRRASCRSASRTASRRCSSRSPCWATSTRPATRRLGSGRSRRTGRGSRSRSSSARAWTLPAPCVLYGYGAYEISIDPSFSHHRLSLLDRGVVFAIAHVRGGGEMGRAWYEDGRMEHKANTFSDFIACGRHLVERGIAGADALAGRGASAGGLLIGAVANEAPDLFRALVAQVPFVDCVTTMLDDELPLTVGEWEEWGNPAGRRVRLLAHALVLPVRQRRRHQP